MVKNERFFLSVPRLRGLRKKSQRKTDGRSDDRTDGRLRRRRRKRPRHRRHESPTEKKTSKGCVIQNADQRSRTIIDRVVVGGGDPLMIRVRLSLAPRARTMFSVEPIDQSARTTTLRFACVVVVKEEKHRQSFHSSFIQPRDGGGGAFVVVSPAYPPIGKSFLLRTVRTPRDLLRPETAA